MSKNITLDNGTEIPVTDEVYEEYYRFKWREEKQYQASLKHEIPIDILIESGNERSTVHNQKLVSEIVEDKLMLEILMSALDKLTKDERHIIDEIYFNDKTERETADKLGLPRKTMTYKRDKILSKLKNILKNI